MSPGVYFVPKCRHICIVSSAPRDKLQGLSYRGINREIWIQIGVPNGLEDSKRKRYMSSCWIKLIYLLWHLTKYCIPWIWICFWEPGRSCYRFLLFTSNWCLTLCTGAWVINSTMQFLRAGIFRLHKGDADWNVSVVNHSIHPPLHNFKQVDHLSARYITVSPWSRIGKEAMYSIV